MNFTVQIESRLFHTLNNHSLWNVDTLPEEDQVWITDLRVGSDQRAESGVELSGNASHRIAALGNINDLAVQEYDRCSRQINDLADLYHVTVDDSGVGGIFLLAKSKRVRERNGCGG